jgi:hypothetical protein
MSNRRLTLAAIGAAAVAAALVGCAAAPTPADYAAEKPVFDLKTYFNGELVAHGVFTDRAGKVARRFVVQLTGTWRGNEGTLDERFTYSDGKTERRIWRLTAAGNALNWRYTLKLPVDDKVYEVQFDDWMYQMDERVMLNKAVMSKFGFRLGEVTLSFYKK